MSELEIGKVNLVKDIIVNLARSLQDLVDGNPESHYIRLPVERCLYQLPTSLNDLVLGRKI